MKFHLKIKGFHFKKNAFEYVVWNVAVICLGLNASSEKLPNTQVEQTNMLRCRKPLIL